MFVQAASQAWGAFLGLVYIAVFFIASVVSLYYGVTNINNKQDPNYEKVALNKVRSEIFCATGGDPMYCKSHNRRHKNVYSHTQCANHTEDSPYMYVTKYIGPMTKTLDRHIETKE